MDLDDATNDNLLYNFDSVNQSYLMVACVEVLVKLCAFYAMNMAPCRNFFSDCLRWNVDTVPYGCHSIAIIAMTVASLIGKLFIPSINTAFGLVGSLTGSFISSTFPTLF